MRIAIYEPEPRVCGPMAWAYHLQAGFKALGHECDVVTCTRSGKPSKTWSQMQQSRGNRWWSRPPDHTFKHSEVINALNGYDLVILSDVMNIGQDKTATKDGTLPVYVHIMRSITTRWLTMMHGNFYEKTPFLPYLLEAANVDTWLTCSPNNTQVNPLLAARDWRVTPLPYVPVHGIDDPIPGGRTVGMTGRFIFNKGQPTFTLLAKYLDPDVITETWGGSSVGLGPSPTYLAYKAIGMLDPDAKRLRHGPVPDDPEGGNIITPYLWDVRLSTGQLIRYLGVYDNPVGVCDRFNVHVSLTTSAFSSWTEFAALEAMDSGCEIVVSDCVAGPDDYLHRTVPDVPNWPAPERQAKLGIESLQPIADTIMSAMVEPARAERARWNREAIARVNNPASVAANFLEVL